MMSTQPVKRSVSNVQTSPQGRSDSQRISFCTFLSPVPHSQPLPLPERVPPPPSTSNNVTVESGGYSYINVVNVVGTANITSPSPGNTES